MIIERKFGELKDGEKFSLLLDNAKFGKWRRIKDSTLRSKNKWDFNGKECDAVPQDETIVYQLITREEQIAALKTIEKPFSLWPKWLQECEVFEELKHKEVWEWYMMAKTWSGIWKFCDDGTPYRLSPTYQDPPKEEEPKEPEKPIIKLNFTVEVEDGKVRHIEVH